MHHLKPAYATACFFFSLNVSSSDALYLSLSPSSLAKLRTVRIVDKTSSATWFALARLSWTLLDRSCLNEARKLRVST